MISGGTEVINSLDIRNQIFRQSLKLIREISTVDFIQRHLVTRTCKLQQLKCRKHPITCLQQFLTVFLHQGLHLRNSVSLTMLKIQSLCNVIECIFYLVPKIWSLISHEIKECVTLVIHLLVVPAKYARNIYINQDFFEEVHAHKLSKCFYYYEKCF